MGGEGKIQKKRNFPYFSYIFESGVEREKKNLDLPYFSYIVEGGGGGGGEKAHLKCSLAIARKKNTATSMNCQFWAVHQTRKGKGEERMYFLLALLPYSAAPL